MRHVPNLLTLMRLALVPAMAWWLAAGMFPAALALFLVSAATDLADGYIARRFGITSRLGAMLDPVADKLSMFAATVLLAWHGLLPLWLAIAIVARDVVIMAGAFAYRVVRGRLKIRPTWLSKVNTALEFAVLLLIMAFGAGWITGGTWLQAVFATVGVTVIASGAQYVWLGSRAAFGRRRAD